MAVQDDNAKSHRGMKSGARTDGARSGDFLTFSHLADTEGKQATCSGDGGERGTEKVGGEIGAESRERTPRLKEEMPTGQSLKVKLFVGYIVIARNDHMSTVSTRSLKAKREFTPSFYPI